MRLKNVVAGEAIAFFYNILNISFVVFLYGLAFLYRYLSVF